MTGRNQDNLMEYTEIDRLHEAISGTAREMNADPLRVYMNARQRLIDAKARMDRLAANVTLVDMTLNGRPLRNGAPPAPSLWKRLSTMTGRRGREINEVGADGKSCALFIGIKEQDWPSFDSAWETLSNWRDALNGALEAWSKLSEQDRSAVAGPYSV